MSWLNIPDEKKLKKLCIQLMINDRPEGFWAEIHEDLRRFADLEARRMGYEGWIDALHEIKE